MNDILSINAHIKYVEYLLYQFDNESGQTTLEEIRNKFHEKFKHKDILLNQFFGIYRLLPLILIKENYKNQKKELFGNIKKIKIIRDSISHNSFQMNENGYIFKNDKEELAFTYDAFQVFLHEIENEFYSSGKD